MALTTRNNGSSPSNLVQASWWNDFKDLLTGTMTDQPVIISNSLGLVAPAAPSSAPSASMTNDSANLSIGTYQYIYTYANLSGAESPPSPTLSVTTTSSTRQVNLSGISTGPAGTTKRNIYRTLVGDSKFLFLGYLNNNTSTTFTDNIPDSSLNSFYPEVGSGGGLLLAANGGNLQGYVGSSTNNGGTVRVHGNGRVEITFNGAEPSKRFIFDTNGLTIWDGLVVSQSVIRVGNSLGIKTVSGTKLAEIKSNGNLVIAGSQYGTTAGSVSTAASQSFDGFDMAETFEVDREYPPGTVLCPADTEAEIPFTVGEGAHSNQPRLTQCSHDGCNLALISVANPGFLAGLINLPSQEDYNPDHPMKMACSMTGRVFARTAYHIPGRRFVCSDGRGGVRPANKGELALGVTVGPTTNGKVPILIRAVML
jgi:hypothetical protein